MEVTAQKRINVFSRIGGKQSNHKVCLYWLEGRCTRNPCKFAHKLPPNAQKKQQHKHKGSDNVPKFSRKMTWNNPTYYQSKKSTFSSTGRHGASGSSKRSSYVEEKCVQENLMASNECDSVTKETLLSVEKVESDNHIGQEIPLKQCKLWVTGNCFHGEKCKDLHSWFSGSGFTMLAKLEGHVKSITGISLPRDCDKLYSGSKDKSLRAWDCNSGQCVGSMSLDGELGCIISEAPWVFVGLSNAVKAWNLQNHIDVTINGMVGQINCMTADDGVLYAGMEDGTILVWKWNVETISPEPVAISKEHNSAVCSLVLGAGALYSCSKDCTVKMWNRDNLQCKQTLYGHESEVTSLLFWDRYLLTGSLNGTIKGWSVNKIGSLDVVYERKYDCGIIAMCGMLSSDKKPILMCSFKDNTVRLYDLPSFSERGRIFSKHEVQVIEAAIDGLFFTGDASGEIIVWKMI